MRGDEIHFEFAWYFDFMFYEYGILKEDFYDGLDIGNAMVGYLKTFMKPNIPDKKPAFLIINGARKD